MAGKPDHRGLVTRRTALAGLAAASGTAIAGLIAETGAAESGTGPVFSSSGPDAELYGAAEGFPIADRSLPIQPGNPYQPKYRVGAFSHFDEIYPTRRIARPETPWTFKRSATSIPSRFLGSQSSLIVSLPPNPVPAPLHPQHAPILLVH